MGYLLIWELREKILSDQTDQISFTQASKLKTSLLEQKKHPWNLSLNLQNTFKIYKFKKNPDSLTLACPKLYGKPKNSKYKKIASINTIPHASHKILLKWMTV